MASVTSKPAAAATNDGDETKDTTVLRVTETPNAMTMDVDVVGPHGAVRCLRQADAQMFAGWKSYPGACSRLSMHNLQLWAHVPDGFRRGSGALFATCEL